MYDLTSDYDYDYGYDDSKLNLCVFDPGGNIILFCLMSKGTFTQHHFQPKTENLCVLVYLHDKGILGT